MTASWVQVDPTTHDPILAGDPTKVTLSNPLAASPTFVAPHFATSTVLGFQLIVTDVPYGLTSAPAFTTVQINANRAPAVGTPTVTPSSRPINTLVTISVPASAADADGDPVAGFTYQWVQTASAAATTGCAPGCPVADVTLTPVSGTPRSATFTAPAFTVASASLFFRLTVNDGFGATVLSNNLTVGLTNTLPVVPATITTRTGIDGSVLNPNNLYVNAPVTIDATSTDPDNAGPLTYEFSGQPCGGLGEALGCLLASDPGGYPGGSCRGMTITPDALIPGKATFTAPTFGPNNPTVCGLRVVVTDAAGGSTTKNWSYGLKANAGAPVAAMIPVPEKVLATTPAAQGVLVLSASPTTDPDTNPTQPLTYTWEQIDPSTGDPVAVGAPSRGTLSNPNSINTTWTAPTTAPHTVKFRLAVSDGLSFPSVITTPNISVTTNRPGADAGPDRLLHPGGHALLDGSGSTDAGGRPITYSWRQISGPPVTLATALSAQASFTTPFLAYGDPSQVYQFELTTRNGLAASFDTMTVVNAPFDQAIADAGANQAVNTATTGVQLDGSGSSTSSTGTIVYHWSQTSGPSVTLSSASAQKPTFTAPAVTQAMGPQHLVFGLFVTDGFSTSEVSSTTVTVNPVAEVPYPPSNVTAVPGNAQATVAYTASTIDSGSPILTYVVRCLSSNGGTPKTGYLPASGVVTGLTNGKDYTCALAGANAIGLGQYSAPSSNFRPAAPPSAPTAVSGVTGAGSATVSFTPGATGGAAFVVYSVQCASSNGGVAAGNLFASSPANVTGMSNGKTYTCTAQAFHSLGSSPVSAPSASFVVGVTSVPDAPTAAAGNTTATVSWNVPASNNGSPVTGYVVTPYIGATAQAPRTFPTTALTQIITGLTNGTAYSFTVAAVNARGTSVASEKSAPAVTIGIPAVPPTATAAPGAGQATVTWTAPANNGSAITGYQVVPYIGAVAQAPQLFAGTALTHVVTGLANGTAYTFAVSAVNARGVGPARTTESVIVGAPTAPGLVTATAGAAKATVTWAASTNSGSPILSYTVTRLVGNVVVGSTTFAGTATTRVITGLTPGTAYTFVVSATNARGAGPMSAPSNAVTPT